jgi:hypothetical protein
MTIADRINDNVRVNFVSFVQIIEPDRISFVFPNARCSRQNFTRALFESMIEKSYDFRNSENVVYLGLSVLNDKMNISARTKHPDLHLAKRRPLRERMPIALIEIR